VTNERPGGSDDGRDDVGRRRSTSVDARDDDDDELGAGFVSRRSIDRSIDHRSME
jgi:hypothetical protein